MDIIHAIRVTCNQLRPPLLRELGLEKSLENLFEHIQLTSTYKINFTSEDFTNLSLSEEQTIGIYRIVQEFLYYAEECSRANTIEFTISYEKDRLMMVYSDDDLESNEVEEKPSTESVRLTSVSQRAQSLGGELHIAPKQGCGLVVLLELPIKLERSFV